MARARERAERADLRVFLLEDGEEGGSTGRRASRPAICWCWPRRTCGPRRHGMAVSGLTGVGIEGCWRRWASSCASAASAAGSLTRERQRQAVERAAAAAVARAAASRSGASGAGACGGGTPRRRLRALDFLIGRVDVEAVLDVIFQSFCIGK